MKMPEVIETVMFAPCGMDCMVCYVHLKKKEPCGGCLGDDITKAERCRSCAIVNCARSRGYIYCYSCAEFPCKRINNLEKSYRKRYQVSLIGNNEEVRNDGLGAFFVHERERWICSECGGVVSLHEKICSECGRRV